MTRTLWGGGDDLDAAVAAYTAGDDRRWDRRLLRWDILGTLGHVEGLAAADLIGPDDRELLVAELRLALRRG